MWAGLTGLLLSLLGVLSGFTLLEPYNFIHITELSFPPSVISCSQIRQHSVKYLQGAQYIWVFLGGTVYTIYSGAQFVRIWAACFGIEGENLLQNWGLKDIWAENAAEARRRCKKSSRNLGQMEIRSGENVYKKGRRHLWVTVYKWLFCLCRISAVFSARWWVVPFLFVKQQLPAYPYPCSGHTGSCSFTRVNLAWKLVYLLFRVGTIFWHPMLQVGNLLLKNITPPLHMSLFFAIILEAAARNWG